LPKSRRLRFVGSCMGVFPYSEFFPKQSCHEERCRSVSAHLKARVISGTSREKRGDDGKHAIRQRLGRLKRASLNIRERLEAKICLVYVSGMLKKGRRPTVVF
jgi:hypothetical protein